MAKYVATFKRVVRGLYFYEGRYSNYLIKHMWSNNFLDIMFFFNTEYIQIYHWMFPNGNMGR